MEPNLTILIQAFNFFIVYLLLKYFLFKPVLEHLQNEEKEQKYIEKSISNQQNLLDEKIEQKNQTWKKYQNYFKKNSPQIKAELFTIDDMEKEPEILELSEKEVNEFSKKMKKALIERVENVR